MNAQQIFVCLLVLGCVPSFYQQRVTHLRRRARRGQKRHRRTVRRVEVQVNAVFWRLAVVRQGGEIVDVRFRLPLIERLQDAIWAAVRQLVP